MQTQTEGKVDKGDTDWSLEFADQDADQSSLEDEGVEEEQEDNNDSKHNADILNPANIGIHMTCWEDKMKMCYAIKRRD